MAIVMNDDVTNGTSGSILFVNSSIKLAQDNANLFWHQANASLGIGTTSPNNGLTVSKASTAGIVRVDCINTDSTNAASSAWLVVSVAGANAGDPAVVFDVSGVRNWAMGIDNNQSDMFKISSSASLGTDDRLTITTTGVVDIPASLTCPLYSSTSTLTVKTEDKTNTATSALSIGTGTVTTGNGSSGSGTVTINTGSGQPNESGSGVAGNSGTVTLTTGPGGSSSGGSSAGASGNLFLKTGTGGGNMSAGASGGPAGHIILQPGSGGSGTSGPGSGGSTIVRASNSGDIFAIQNSAGSTTHLAVSNSGNLRVGTASSAALLQLGAGTASLPPLKLTAGTNLTTPQAGAMEFDGTNLFITLSDGTRRLLTSDVANVRDFGAAAAGSTDDAAAIQDAVDSLISTGGVVYFPPGFKYIIGSQINIKSQLPIWVISHMSGAGYGAGFAGTTAMSAKAIIQPKSGLTGSIFCWDFVDGLDDYSFLWGGPGGGISGIRFVDWDSSENESRNVDFIAAIHVKAAGYFTIRDCNFGGLKASAIKVTQCVICDILQCKAHQCGDAGSPVLDIGGTLGTAAVNDQSITPGDDTLGVDTVILNLPDTDLIPVGTAFPIAGESGSPVHVVTARTGNPTTSITFEPDIGSGVADNAVITFYPFAGVYADWVFLEASFGDYTIKVHAKSGGLTGDHLYFENVSPYNPDLSDNTVFIDADGGLDLCNVTFNANTNTAIVMRAAGSTLRNVQGTTYADTLPIIKVDASRCVLSGIDINGSSTTGPAILVTANGFQSRISDVYFLTGGAIDVSAASFCMLSNIHQLLPTSGTNTYAIDLGVYNTLDHAIVDGTSTTSGSTCNAIRGPAFCNISNAQVYRLNGTVTGITTTAGDSQVMGCSVHDLANTDTPYVFADGTSAWNNYPWQDGVVYRNVAASGAVTTTSETDFDKSYTIPARRLRAGAVIRIRSQAFATSAAGGGTLRLRLKIGSTVIQDTGAITAGSNFVGYFDSTLIVRTIGSSGTVVGTSAWGLGTKDVVTPIVGLLASTSIDTTASQTVKMSAQWSNSGNSVRLDIFTVEILSSGDVG